GKPEAATVALVRQRFGTTGVVVGDRPSTDGALADAIGWPFALVLSGVAGRAGEEGVPDPAPPFVAADLAHLAPDLAAAYAHACAPQQPDGEQGVTGGGCPTIWRRRKGRPHAAKPRLEALSRSRDAVH